MSLYKDASLVMIPSAYKDGKLYSIRPTDGDGDFTFSRGTTATRVDVNGLIEKGRENLLLQSNQFDTSPWGGSNISLTSGQSGYDGSNNAWKITAVGTGGGRKVQQAVSTSGVTSFSVYAKAGTANYIALEGGGTGGFYEYFSLIDGTDGLGLGNINVNSENVGNGWWRFTIVGNPSSLSSVNIFASNTNNATDIGDGLYIYIQDAQLEAGLVATDYIETGASTAQAGILEDMPRLDYSGGASCPALLLEPQRTNIFQHSEYFSGSYWAKTGTGGANAPVVTQNYAISPEGLKNASRVQFDTNGSTSSHRSGLVRDFAFTTGDKYAISCWVKSASGSDEIFTFRIAGAQVGGEKTATSEWQLFTETHTATATTTDNFGMQIRGNYSSQTSDILIYGMQLESAVSYPTSYIPTYGASVTRSTDSCLATSVSDVIGQTQGTMFFEIDQPYADGVNGAWSISDGSSSNRVTMNTLDVNSTTFTLSVAANYAGGSTNVISTNTTYGLHKVAIQYIDTTLKIFVDGAEATSGSTDGFGNYTNFYIGANQVGTGDEIREFKQAVLFPTALTDSECIALTTL